MNNKPWAYVTSAWSTDRNKARRSAKRYCRKLYEVGYTPICPLLSFPEVIDVSNADEYKCKCILSHPSGGFFTVAKRKEKTYVCKVRQAP